MKRENPIREKSYVYAPETVHFCKRMMEEKNEYILSKQLMKSGTSIGANIEEALQAESTADFVHKLSIALKEAHESRYWLNIIHDSGYEIHSRMKYFFAEVDEIIALLTSIIKSTKKRM